jgi:hypothetical protein
MSDQVVLSVEIGSRNRQIEVTTMQRGSGRHSRYHSLSQVPPSLRGEALALIRQAVLNAGYASLAELDEALTSDIVVPEADETEEGPAATS